MHRPFATVLATTMYSCPTRHRIVPDASPSMTIDDVDVATSPCALLLLLGIFKVANRRGVRCSFRRDRHCPWTTEAIGSGRSRADSIELVVVVAAAAALLLLLLGDLRRPLLLLAVMVDDGTNLRYCRVDGIV